MTTVDVPHSPSLEAQIAKWRSLLGRRREIHALDVEELEDHLRGEIAPLADAGLPADEAFLAAARRMGTQDAIATSSRASTRTGPGSNCRRA